MTVGGTVSLTTTNRFSRVVETVSVRVHARGIDMEDDWKRVVVLTRDDVEQRRNESARPSRDSVRLSELLDDLDDALDADDEVRARACLESALNKTSKTENRNRLVHAKYLLD